MDILIIGGTRNLGYLLAKELYDAGHRITILNRDLSADESLPETIAHFTCDRTDYPHMRRILNGRQFDVVIDTVLYTEKEAEEIVELLDCRVGHYIFLSTGQVYLVQDEYQPPYQEDEYQGGIVEKPDELTYDYEEWLYGVDKRSAEDALVRAYADKQFPYTSLRLPMVNSERQDKFQRLYSYILRIKDGGPILVPAGQDLPLRHVYADDVVQVVMRLIETGKGKGRAYNICQDESLSLTEFLTLLSEVIGQPVEIVEVDRKILTANGFLPNCSPYSDVWMSEMDNTRSKEELGMQYTTPRDYLQKIVAYYEEYPPDTPSSYRRRHAEKQLIVSSKM